MQIPSAGFPRAMSATEVNLFLSLSHLLIKSDIGFFLVKLHMRSPLLYFLGWVSMGQTFTTLQGTHETSDQCELPQKADPCIPRSDEGLNGCGLDNILGRCKATEPSTLPGGCQPPWPPDQCAWLPCHLFL